MENNGEIELVEFEEDFRLRATNREHGPQQVVGVKNLPDVDVMVFTRILARNLAQIIPIIQSAGIAVVVDIDDDFRHTPPLMAGREKIQPTNTEPYNWQWTAEACAAADLVTCSTPALTRYGSEGSAVVVRNCVPHRYLTIQAERDGKTVGWGGTVASHPGDLDVTHGGVARAIEKTGGNFMVVGDKRDVRARLNLQSEPVETGLIEHERYAFKIAEFDVGIAPLADNAYNRAKSYLKPLEYMALGVPCVVSPRPEYKLLYNSLMEWMGESDCAAPIAIAASRGREWSRDVYDALRRAEDGSQGPIQEVGRQYVAEHHTIEGQGWRWAECWQRAVSRRKMRSGGLGATAASGRAPRKDAEVVHDRPAPRPEEVEMASVVGDDDSWVLSRGGVGRYLAGEDEGEADR